MVPQSFQLKIGALSQLYIARLGLSYILLNVLKTGTQSAFIQNEFILNAMYQTLSVLINADTLNAIKSP